jgi:hypothetical protein
MGGRFGEKGGEVDEGMVLGVGDSMMSHCNQLEMLRKMLGGMSNYEPGQFWKISNTHPLHANYHGANV